MNENLQDDHSSYMLWLLPSYWLAPAGKSVVADTEQFLALISDEY